LKKYFDSLRPFEKRVVVGVGLALFAVLNFWFVFPHFSDMSQMANRREAALTKLAKYQAARNLIPSYKSQISKLTSDGGPDVPSEERKDEFLRTINTEEGRSGVSQINGSKISTRTNNAYFLELSQTISVQSSETNLVDFLYNLGAGSSLIRVRGLNLRPDPPRNQLSADVTLVASYQKTPPKPGTKSGSSPAKASSSK
jgi:hypothetical protein